MSGHCVIYDVTIAELIAHPREFHGKRVRLSGYVHLEFECNGIYATREEGVVPLVRNGLWIEPTGFGADSVNNHYVLVEATVDAIRQGHFGMWSGTLDKIARIEPMDRPSGPIEMIDLTEPPVRSKKGS